MVRSSGGEVARGEGVWGPYGEQGGLALLHTQGVLEAAGLVILSMGVVVPTLDDVFLRQTGRSRREAGIG